MQPWGAPGSTHRLHPAKDTLWPSRLQLRDVNTWLACPPLSGVINEPRGCSRLGGGGPRSPSPIAPCDGRSDGVAQHPWEGLASPTFLGGIHHERP